MKLHRVDIKNFRSVHDVQVNIDPACRVLVGINESGKSNILRALSLLSKDYLPVKKDDLREALPDEDQIDESFVRFVFRFEKNESDRLFEIISGQILAKTNNPEIILTGGKKKTLKEFCITHNEALYTVDILKERKFSQSWNLGKNKLIAGWKKPTNACPPDFNVNVRGKEHQLSKYNLIQAVEFSDVPEEYLGNAEINDFTLLFVNALRALTQDNLPNILFWEYDEGNLLPNSVNIEEFSNSPDSCLPLRNMFALANIDDIKDSIEDQRKRTKNQFQNYLTRVATKTTNHFREVWKEYRNIEFSLELNADQIIPGVKERNTHDFARRSDGFKRFVTFLLMISAKVRTGNIRDTLLLIDDPGVGLHPSGERYLRDELIKISKTNYVVYSTHSIFMIDSGDIARHYIVTKKDEITSIESAKESNIADEEVLYNALGHSVFAILKEKNLIFEGWKDKHLFLLALGNASADLKEKFNNVGVCHAKGVGTIKAITPMIELANRGCLIVSDSDKPAKDQQKIYKRDKGFGEWKKYQDIDSSIEAITGEDFVKNDFIAKQVRLVLVDSSMPVFNETVLPNKNKLVVILKWFKDNGMTADQAGDTVTKVKNSIFENLKPRNIEDTYTKLLDGLSP